MCGACNKSWVDALFAKVFWFHEVCDLPREFSQINYYYLRLLLIFKGQALNMPFYLISSLQKMAYSFQNNTSNRDRNLFHHVLVNILIHHRLSRLGDNWDSFIVHNNFGVNKEWPQRRQKTRCKRKIVVAFNPNEELDLFLFLIVLIVINSETIFQAGQQNF